MNKSQLILGTAIILISIVVLLANINVAFARELVSSWWPLLIVGLGLYILWTARHNLAWGLIVTGIGVGLLVNTLGVFGLSFEEVFVPIVLLAIGTAVLAGASKKNAPIDQQNSRSEETVSAILGGVNARNNSADYRGGGVNAVLGGAELDLSQSIIKNEAVLRVWVFMGSITLRVPEGVIIKQRTMNILGGTEDRTANRKDTQAPVLYIDGTITMGSVEIKH